MINDYVNTVAGQSEVSLPSKCHKTETNSDICTRPSLTGAPPLRAGPKSEIRANSAKCDQWM